MLVKGFEQEMQTRKATKCRKPNKQKNKDKKLQETKTHTERPPPPKLGKPKWMTRLLNEKKFAISNENNTKDGFRESEYI